MRTPKGETLKVAVLNPTFAEALAMGPDGLRQPQGLRLDTRPELLTGSRENLRTAIRQTDAIVCPSNVPGFPQRSDLEHLPNLRVVAIASSGYEEYDLPAFAERNIRVVNTKTRLSALSVAEHAVSMTMAVLRRWPIQFSAQARGDSYRQVGRLISEIRVGVVGYGSTGRQTARLFNALGASVSVVTRRGKLADVEEGLDVISDIDHALPNLDVVSLHLRLEPTTRIVLDRRRLNLLPTGAVVVNAARRELVDEGALAEMLQSGKLGGAALDDLPNDPELLEGTNCLIFNHIGNRSKNGMIDVVRVLLDDLTALAVGEQPVNEVRTALPGAD